MKKKKASSGFVCFLLEKYADATEKYVGIMIDASFGRGSPLWRTFLPECFSSVPSASSNDSDERFKRSWVLGSRLVNVKRGMG